MEEKFLIQKKEVMCTILVLDDGKTIKRPYRHEEDEREKKTGIARKM